MLWATSAEAAGQKYFLSLRFYGFVKMHCSNRSTWHTQDVLILFTSEIQASVSPIIEYSVTTVLFRQLRGGTDRLVERK